LLSSEVYEMSVKGLIIIPAFNEALNIGRVLDDIRAHAPDFDVIVVDDGSTDSTADVAARCNAGVLRLPHNLGIGGAMQAGYKYAGRKGYDVAVQFDGDGQHRADQLEILIGPIREANADAVIGSRFLGVKTYESRFARLLGIKILSQVVSFFVGQRITDPTSGFRAVNRQVMAFFVRIYPDDYPEPEAVVLLHRAGFKMAEVPVLMRERLSGRSSITALKAFYYMTKVLLAIMIDVLKRAPAR
jgi:glycosyltransferase involved in cell wall biosynthesis